MNLTNLASIPRRAVANLPLTPGERALLKLGQNLAWVALVAALGVATPLIASGAFSLNRATLGAIAGAAVVAALNALQKLVTARADPPLAAPVPGESAVK